MAKHLTTITALTILGAWGWLALASAIYCKLTSKAELLLFPYMQWAEAAPWWRANWFMTACVVISAGIPTLLLAAGTVITWRIRHRRKLVLYGQSGDNLNSEHISHIHFSCPCKTNPSRAEDGPAKPCDQAPSCLLLRSIPAVGATGCRFPATNCREVLPLPQVQQDRAQPLFRRGLSLLLK